MKKLLSLLGVATITSSTAFVASCSLVNNTKQLIKNEVKNLIEVSSLFLRGSMIQNATQELDRGLALDSNYLNKIIGSKKMNEISPSFNTSDQTLVNDLNKSYFGDQVFDRDSVNLLNNNKDGNSFLNSNTKSAEGPADGIGGILTLLASAIKSTNGISPGLIGTLEGALGMIASDDLANSVLGMLPENLGDVLGGIGPTIEPILDLLSNSGIVYGLIANLLNINFINGISEGNTEVIMSSIMNLLPSLLNVIVKIVGNSFETMFNDFDGNPEDITNKMVINSAIIRLNNTLIDLIGDKGDQNLKENNLYISDDKEYKTFIDNKFNKAFSNLISNIDSLDLGGIISHISDLLFIIGAFVRTIGSVNFSDFSPKDSLHLYSNEKENKDIIKEIRNQKISNLDMSVVSNNLSIAFSNKDSNKNGLQLQKLINLLFFSESNKKELNDVGSVLGLLLYGINNGGFSPILNSLGLGLKSILNIPVIGDQIPKVLVILFDNLSNDYSMKFLNDILGSILPGLDFSKPFTSLWDNFLSGLFTENDFSLKTEEVINSFNSNLKNYDLKLNKNISDGLKELGNGLSDRIYSFYLPSEKPWTPENSVSTTFNAVEALMFAGAHGGLSIKITSSTKADDFDETLTGRKAAMQALGMNYSNLNEFRENSLLSGLKKVVENPSIMNIFDQIIDGFTKTTNDKNDYSKEYFEPMINSSNFENILISNSKMNTELGEEKIVYETIFTDPISKKEFNYEIVLLLKENERIWKVNSIKRI